MAGEGLRSHVRTVTAVSGGGSSRMAMRLRTSIHRQPQRSTIASWPMPRSFAWSVAACASAAVSISGVHAPLAV